jgi:hypothetical protein
MEDLPVQRHQTSLQYRFKNQVYLAALEQNKGDKDRAETLANVWFNVNFLGCRYGEKLMQQIEALTPEEFKEYSARRKL